MYRKILQASKNAFPKAKGNYRRMYKVYQPVKNLQTDKLKRILSFKVRWADNSPDK